MNDYFIDYGIGRIVRKLNADQEFTIGVTYFDPSAIVHLSFGDDVKIIFEPFFTGFAVERFGFPLQDARIVVVWQILVARPLCPFYHSPYVI